MQVTADDIGWANNVNIIAKRAFTANKQRNYSEAIKFYRQALELAPGCDLYLMSIGSCFANMGQLQKATKYLERAAEICPANKRIRRNLAEVTRMRNVAEVKRMLLAVRQKYINEKNRDK